MKKTIIILVVAIVLVLGIFLLLNSADETNLPPDSGRDFPSGDSAQDNTFPGATDPSASNGGGNGAGAFPDSSVTSNNSSLTTNITKEARRISDAPVSGATSFGTLSLVNLTVRYIDASSGNIWDYRPLGNERKKVTAVTIPRIKEVYWGNKGQSALVRYQDETGERVKNYLLRIPVATTSAVQIEGSFLPDNLLTVTVAPPGDETTTCPDYITKTLSKDGSNDPAETRRLQTFLEINVTGLFDTATIEAVKSFQKANGIESTGNVGPLTRTQINKIYCTKTPGRVVGGRLFYTSTDGAKTIGSVVDFDNKKTTNVFSSSFGEWALSWPIKQTLVLTTKPSGEAAGFAYSAPAAPASSYSLFSSPSLKSLLRNVSGLTISPSPNLANIVYSQASTRGFATKILDVKTGESRDFPVVTFPAEKCVWDKKDSDVIYCAAPEERILGSQPDNWYMGLSSFSDNIYKINTDTDTAELIFSPKGENQGPDISYINISEDNSLLYFIDKTDDYLWILPL